MESVDMDYGLWGNVEKLLKVGWTYSKIKEFTRVREEDIKKIDDYVKERENAKRDIAKSN